MVREIIGPHNMMSRGYILAHCPWHSDSEKSLLVFPDGWWRCVGACDACGRIEQLYEALQNPGAVRPPHSNNTSVYPPKLPTDLEEIDTLVWRAHDALRRNDEFKWYLKMRGI